MKLGYVILYVPDIAKAASFYEAAFGLTSQFVAPSGQFAAMDTGDTVLGFASESFVAGNVTDFARQRPGGNPQAVEIAFIADDVAAAVERAAGAGATIVKRPEVKPWGQTVAYVRDLNGALVELCTKMG